MPDSRTHIVTRMAPSPTGNLHVGGIRTALFNYLFARQNGGTFILRSEDTDQERSKKEYEDQILEIFSWLGLDYDAFYRQSERTAFYVQAIETLLEKGLAYKAESSKDHPDREVIRFKNPNTIVTFSDLLLGEISVDTSDLGDFVIARDIENPLYHLTVVVDDALMGITHVIRGQEHLANTPRQILLLEALGYSRPLYMHIPLILSPRGGKLSKRDPEVVPVLDYRRDGFLPEALLNFLSLIGWNPGTEEEIFSLSDLVQKFSIDHIQKSSGVFNHEKLLWVNREHIKRLDSVTIETMLRDFLPDRIKDHSLFENIFPKIVPLVVERISTFGEARALAEKGELDYFFEHPTYSPELLIWKKSTHDATREHLKALKEILAESSLEAWNTVDECKSIVWPYADSHGRGDVLWPLRVALSGQEKSPDPFMLMHILGKETSLERLDCALEYLS